MIKTSIETKVGILFFLTLVILGVFVYLLGVFNPFTPTYKLDVLYNYAGGLSIGAPVQVAGVKVGRVSDIEIINSYDKNDLKVKVTLLLRKSIKTSISSDSKFFINISGLIGEKYIEIKPGISQKQLGPTIIGVDPPRIDQLISQSYDLFSKIESMMIANKGNFSKALSIVENLTKSINALFEKTSKKDGENIRTIISNFRKITEHTNDLLKKSKTDFLPVLSDIKPTIKNIKKSSENIEKLTAFLGSLSLKEKNNFEESIKNLLFVSNSLKELSKQLESIMSKEDPLMLNEFKTIFQDSGIKVRLFN